MTPIALAALIFASATALAGSGPTSNPIAGFYSMAPPDSPLSSLYDFAIPLVTEEYCRHYLEKLFPATALRDGMAALRALNAQPGAAAQRQCTEGLLKNWDELTETSQGISFNGEEPEIFSSCPTGYNRSGLKYCFQPPANENSVSQTKNCSPGHVAIPQDYNNTLLCYLRTQTPPARQGQAFAYHWLRQPSPTEITLPAQYLERAVSYLQRRLLGSFTADLARGSAVDSASFCKKFSDRQTGAMNFLRASLAAPDQLTPPNSVRRHLRGSNSFALDLDEIETANIQSYMGSYYDLVNGALWKRTASPTMEKYIASTTAGLSRLPVYRGASLRFTTLPEAVLRAHQVGQIVTYEAFTSSSRNLNFSWAGQHRFVIYSARSGRYVEPVMYSGSKSAEDEVLFPPGTRFKVVGRLERPRQRVDFILAEVDENDAVTLPPPSPRSTPPLIFNPF